VIGAQVAPSGKDFTSFNSNGFSVGPFYTNSWNFLDRDFVSWTFRKAKNFFDVVTYTGDGVAGREIPHNLGVEPGMIIVKHTSSTSNWYVYHRSLTSANYGLALNKVDAEVLWGGGSVNSDTFSFDHQNSSDSTYVAYLFAHDDSDESMIKCGSFTTDGSGNATVSLGWEPQFILRKQADGVDWWNIADVMRGFNTSNTASLYPNTTDPEYVGPTLHVPNADGFDVTATTPNATYIYMAIRRPTKPAEEFEPEELFADLPNTYADGDPGFKTGFPVDMAISADVSTGGDKDIASRLTGTKRLETNTDNPEGNQTYNKWDYMDGFMSGFNGSDYGWLWRRAPGYFDVTCHTSNGQPTQQIYHNLGVIPEMAWIKGRSLADSDWFVHHKDITAGNNLRLNTNQPELTDNSITAATFTESYWTPGDSGYHSGGSYTQTYIAYLFATVPGISKVGSYTGNGSEVEVDCGFTNGARWALIKSINNSGDWLMTTPTSALNFMVALNTTDPMVGVYGVEPTPSGFKAKHSLTNTSGIEYIYYAIA
jgi:hypothetical protein